MRHNLRAAILPPSENSWSKYEKLVAVSNNNINNNNKILCTPIEGRVSTVGVTTGYGVRSPGIESRWGRYFPRLSRPALGPTQPPIQRVPGFFKRVKLPGRGVGHPPHLTPRLKKDSDPLLDLRGLF